VTNVIRTPRMLDAAQEAELQARIAVEPDARELTDDELARMRPAREALPPALYAALTRRDRPASPNDAEG
jgi:uncharacterized protein (DUF4415 family)